MLEYSMNIFFNFLSFINTFSENWVFVQASWHLYIPIHKTLLSLLKDETYL